MSGFFYLKKLRMKKLFFNYTSSFSGLSPEVWWLSLITLINRAGTMVIPFLSLYLTKNLGFSTSNVGWILTFFGLGSVAGSWLGGKLTDKIGFYKVMAGSLLLSGILFIGLQYLTSFWGICFGIFIVMLVADSFRPAVFVALSVYSKPQNKIRSVTLIRLAINLGFFGGPTIGGLIITNIGYDGLFWVDGITCIMAGILLLRVLNPKKVKALDETKNENPASAYKDYTYLVFILAMVLFGFVFLQYFSTVPLYYENIHKLSEDQIGLLLGFSGLIIFLLEMPLVKYLESKPWSNTSKSIIGCILLVLSFLILNLTAWQGVLIIGLFLMTVGEMIVFPFSNAFALESAKKGNQGEYMALYSIAFSISHVFGHNSGMQLISKVGYDKTWYFMSLLGGLCILILFYLRNKIKRST